MADWGILAVLAALVGGASKAGKPAGPIGIPWTETPTQTPSTPTDVFNISPGIDLHIAGPNGLPSVPAGNTNMTAPTAPNTAAPVRYASTGWRWFTPGGVIESRPKTPEEEQGGLGCPEIPGIWDSTRNSPTLWKYCQNASCPSNKPETDPYTRQNIPATPAVLQQEVDKATGQVSYYCPVCRQRT